MTPVDSRRDKVGDVYWMRLSVLLAIIGIKECGIWVRLGVSLVQIIEWW